MNLIAKILLLDARLDEILLGVPRTLPKGLFWEGTRRFKNKITGQPRIESGLLDRYPHPSKGASIVERKAYAWGQHQRAQTKNAWASSLADTRDLSKAPRLQGTTARDPGEGTVTPVSTPKPLFGTKLPKVPASQIPKVKQKLANEASAVKVAADAEAADFLRRTQARPEDVARGILQRREAAGPKIKVKAPISKLAEESIISEAERNRAIERGDNAIAREAAQIKSIRKRFTDLRKAKSVFKKDLKTQGIQLPKSAPPIPANVPGEQVVSRTGKGSTKLKKEWGFDPSAKPSLGVTVKKASKAEQATFRATSAAARAAKGLTPEKLAAYDKRRAILRALRSFRLKNS